VENVSDIQSPFYRGKDPMKEVYWKHKNADGTWGFAHNPFFNPEGVQYGSTWQRFNMNNDMPWLFQPEVDPYHD